MNGARGYADRRPGRRPEPVLPMINLVFLLLVFFLMAAIIVPQPPVAVREPEANPSGGFESASLRIAVDREGTVHFGTSRDSAALEALATELSRSPVSSDVAIHADGAAPAARLLGLLQQLTEISAGPVWLVTEPGQ